MEAYTIWPIQLHTDNKSNFYTYTQQAAAAPYVTLQNRAVYHHHQNSRQNFLFAFLLFCYFYYKTRQGQVPVATQDPLVSM